MKTSDTSSFLRHHRQPPISNQGEKNHPMLNAAKLGIANQHGVATSASSSHASWIVTKWAILRLTGIVYLIAFLGAYYQNQGLMGSDGLQPATEYFDDRLRQQFADPYDGFQKYPSIFWLVDLNDGNLSLLYRSGLALSFLVVLGLDSMIVMGVLWLLYFSIVTTAGGSTFYNYGWESQLLETGFLCIFLCDVFPQFGRAKHKCPPSPIILWLFRWLCFRISMGAGLIKIRGDSCWTQKTCLHYHFETQPIPSPTSFIFHFLPKWALTHAVDLDLFVQVYTSWLVLCPTYFPFSNTLVSNMFLWIVRLGGFIQTGFMVNIILSGNFAFLNHLTIIPALACLDDACWPSWLVRFVHTEARALRFRWKIPRLIMDMYLLWLIGTLSRPVVDNLLQLDGKQQQMNASFGSFRLVNTYGAFGSVGQARFEPIVSITYNSKDWVELEFPCKPGSVSRRPCFCAPYHYRVDWNIWFIGFKPHDRMLHGRESWLFAFVSKLMDKRVIKRPWLDLLDASSAYMLRENYETKFKTPICVKVDMYRYEMAAPLWEILPTYLAGKEVVWWNRTLEEVLIPPVQLDQESQRLVLAQL